MHAASGTRVAIKYLSPMLSGDPGFLAGFRSEAQLPRSLAAATTRAVPSARPATPAPQPGAITVDEQGQPLNPRIVVVERETLAAARDHDAAAIDKLLDPSEPASAVNKILVRPGAYQQIITLLTKTHGETTDGATNWPSFTLAGINVPLSGPDATALGITNSNDDKGRITISIGGAGYGYLTNPSAPITLNISTYTL